MSDIDRFREVARLMNELDAKLGFNTVIFGNATPVAPGEVHLERTSESPREWCINGEAATAQRVNDAEKLRELAKLLNESHVVAWRGTLWIQDRDLEDPDAVYLKHVATGFLGLFGKREWRVSLDA